MPVAPAPVPVFKRANVVYVPLLMLRVLVVLVMLPTTLSCGWPLTVVLVKVGALEAEPKFRVPLLMLKTHGTMIGVEDGLSSNVQFAPEVFIRTLFVPLGSVLAKRFVRMPIPERLSVLNTDAVLVRPPPMMMELLVAASASAALKSKPRSIVCGFAELLLMLPTGTMGLPFSTNAPAAGRKTNGP